jgi:hypothetical protein
MSTTIFARKAGSTPEPSYQVVAVDAPLAEKWLGRNNRNRHVRSRKVDEFARDMSAGNWQFNGDTIRISANGNLLDGQHRLLAVVQSECTIKFLVVSGLAESSQDTMDIGAKRSMADQLALSGEVSTNQLAAVLRKVMILDSQRGWNRTAAPTYAEMRAYFTEHPEIRFATDVAQQSRTELPCPPSVIGATYQICAAIDRSAANVFFVDQLINSIGLRVGDPAHTLKKRLRAEAGEGSDHGSASRNRMSEDNVIRYVFTAWNAFRDGRQVTKLQAPKGGWAGNFPEPR